MKKTTMRLALFGALASTAATSSAQISTEVLRDFSGCDASFFRSLAREVSTTALPATMQRKDDVAWFKVKNRQNEKENQLDFEPPLDVGGLRLQSYFDESSDLDSLGKFYSWGFIAEGTLDEVATAFKPYIKNLNRLRRGTNDYARTEMKIGKSPWLPLNISSGAAPRRGTVERVLVLEPLDDDKKAVRITCSLQGAVTGALLQEERPDIDPADYPAPPAEVDISLRQEVLKNVDAAAPADSVWRPRFRKISYTANYRGGKKPFTLPFEMEARDGLIYSREIYTPNFNVERASLAGFVLLRGTMRGLINSVNVTTELTLSLPAKLAPGEKITLKNSSQQLPPAPGDKPSQLAFSCEVGQAAPANSIYPSLTGMATMFSCQYPESGDKKEFALLEDLGLAVETKTESVKYGNSVVSYSKFEVTK